MILVDTSVWIDHLRRGNARLVELLEAETVACHLFVIGELACGSMRNRDEVLALLGKLPTASIAAHGEVMIMLEVRRLMGRGLGYIDLHLLTAASLDRLRLWTLDKRLASVAEELGIAF